MSYQNLNQDQRYHIYELKQEGYFQKDIAKAVGVHPSTISRELNRNCSLRGYRPHCAQEKADARKVLSSRNAKFDEGHMALVEGLLRESYSPEQIVVRTVMEGTLSISMMTIYRHIAQDKRQGGDLWVWRRHPKPYRYTKGKTAGVGKIPNRVGIEERPAIVAEKTRVGDWEADTVIGKDGKGAIVTLVDRVTRLTLGVLVESKNSDEVADAMIEALAPYTCHTITPDNGLEFAKHAKVAEALGATFYFARPYCSQDRGLNENHNGLLREFIPKKTDFSTITQAHVDWAVSRINHRPKKCLGFRSPYEVHFGVTMRYTRHEAEVALQM